MEILILSSLPQDSGCFLRAKYLADALKRAGHGVSLPKEPKGISFLLHMILSFARNIFLVLCSKADVGICIKPYPNTLWPLLLGKLFKRRFFVVTDIDDLDYGYRKGLLSKLSCILQSPFPKHCDLVTYHNDNLYRHIQEDFLVPQSKLYRLNQGVDFHVYGNPDKTAVSSLRQKLVEQSGFGNPLLLAYSAHLNIASDLDDIFQALTEVFFSFPGFYLVVAGGGPLLADFRNRASRLPFARHICFTGHLSPQEVSLHLAAADYGLVYYADKPVNHYRTSMKIREYLALGMDVICNNVGDLQEFKDLTFQSGPTPHDYALKILEVLTEQRRLPSAIKIDSIKRKYDWESIAEDFALKLQHSL